MHRLHGMVDPLVAVFVDVLFGSKRPLVDFLLGSLVYQSAFGSGKRRVVVIVFKKVLTQLRPNGFKQVTHVADNGVVASNGMVSLIEVIETHAEQKPGRNG